jgi:uncharacterized membrane protein YqaE (UPF0057 family)
MRRIYADFLSETDSQISQIATFTPYKSIFLMSCMRVILAIIFPPLSVIDKGCGSVVIVFLLTLAGWIPGVIAALIILNKGK